MWFWGKELGGGTPITQGTAFSTMVSAKPTLNAIFVFFPKSENCLDLFQLVKTGANIGLS